MNVTAKYCLKLVVVANPDLAYPEREFLDDMIHEADGFCLSVPVIGLEGAGAGSITDRFALKTAHFRTAFSSKGQKLNFRLDVMPRHLLIAAVGVDIALSVTAWEAA